jgi:hypothetical protein
MLPMECRVRVGKLMVVCVWVVLLANENGATGRGETAGRFSSNGDLLIDSNSPSV